MWNIGPSLGSCVPPAGEHSPTSRPYTDGSTSALHLPQGTLERDRMAQGEPNQLYWAGFFLFGPFPEENMFGFS